VGKLLFWAVIIIGLLVAARVLARQAGRHADNPQPRAQGQRPQAMPAPESMVRCAHCGIHLPRSEAVLMNGQTWCSQEHASLRVK